MPIPPPPLLTRHAVREALAGLASSVTRQNAPTASRSDKIDAYRTDPAQLMIDAGFRPDPWQSAFLRSTNDKALMLCARQVGKSLTVSCLALHTILVKPDQTVIVIAQREDQAAELLRKSITAFYRIGAPAKVKYEGSTHFELATGSRILALPGKESAVHGPTANLLILDEAARIPDAVFFAASPQLSASKGRLVALSTAFSKSGWFYKEWTEGVGYRKWSITASECPRHTAAFLAHERRIMGERWFSMAYLNQFGDDMAAVFSSEDIDRAVSKEVKPLFPVQKPASETPIPVTSGIKPLFPVRR